MTAALYQIREATSDDAAVIVEFNRRLAWETEHKRLDPALVGPGVAKALRRPELARYFVAQRCESEGGPAEVIELLKGGAKLKPVTIDPGQRTNFQQLMSSGKAVTDPGLPSGWTNFYRSDDVSAVAFFYLDAPVSGLPALASAADRLAALRPPAQPEMKAAEPGNPGQ